MKITKIPFEMKIKCDCGCEFEFECDDVQNDVDRLENMDGERRIYRMIYVECPVCKEKHNLTKKYYER